MDTVLDIDRIGEGPRVVLVHGSIVGGSQTWRRQRELGARWELWVANRPGFGTSDPLPRGDFDHEAPLFAELLGDGAHLVGHSYGAVIALLAAAQRPDAVRSLTVSEPGLLRLGAGDPVADRMIEQGERMYRAGPMLAPEDFLRMFRLGVHSSHATPDELPPALAAGVRHAARERPAWHAEVPFDPIAAASFPVLVISGGHSPVFEAVCDTVADQTGGERHVLAGRGHTIPSLGAPYNDLLEEFLVRAEHGGGPAPQVG